MNSTGSPPVRDRARGLFTGVGLGDAMGAAFEGKPSVSELTLREFERSQHQLRYTDDTALTIAVAEHLLERASCGGHLLDEGELAAALTGAWNREPWRGFARTAANLFEQLNSGMPWRDAAVSVFRGQGSFGNGGAMRCAPVALAAKSAHHAAELGRRTASVTHAHPDGQEGAALQACSVYLALHTHGPLDAESFLHKLAHTIHEPEWARRLQAVAAQLGHRDPHRAAEALGNDVRATHSVPLALWAFLAHAENPIDVVRQCIRAGGDTDTIASMAAALAGALRGAAGWPQSWLRRIEGIPRLHDLGDRLACLSARAARRAAGLVTVAIAPTSYRLEEQMNPETPEADAAEQARQAEEVPNDEELESIEVPLDADPADLADQHRAVPVDDSYDHD